MSAARILTVRQPWAWAIIHGGKNVENRARNLAGDYRGPVLIHVAQHVDLAAFSGQSAALTAAAAAFNESNTDVLKSGPWHADRGAIIGVVDLVDVHEDDSAACYSCSDWADRGWHLILKNPRALDEPIPYKGALGLRRSAYSVSGDWLSENVTLDPKHGMCTPHGCPPSCSLKRVARLVATS